MSAQEPEPVGLSEAIAAAMADPLVEEAVRGLLESVVRSDMSLLEKVAYLIAARAMTDQASALSIRQLIAQAGS